ncbi:hypothetical protein PR048_033254 [Dryococelus australis]|uniref:Uncharacterized protein n=1 Tax=Dryococelus australis TaxID=614101 RepID=A0ABQ9FZS5_9NEOP|nr:hypothetical protein PR048_033254 [Dryococelus australis]
MRMTEVSIEQRRNERAGETGDHRENPPTDSIVRHDCHMRKSGVARPVAGSTAVGRRILRDQDGYVVVLIRHSLQHIPHVGRRVPQRTHIVDFKSALFTAGHGQWDVEMVQLGPYSLLPFISRGVCLTRDYRRVEVKSKEISATLWVAGPCCVLRVCTALTRQQLTLQHSTTRHYLERLRPGCCVPSSCEILKRWPVNFTGGESAAELNEFFYCVKRNAEHSGEERRRTEPSESLQAASKLVGLFLNATNSFLTLLKRSSHARQEESFGEVFRLSVECVCQRGCVTECHSGEVRFDPSRGASEKQFRDTDKTPYNRVKRCRERKINIKASESVNVDGKAYRLTYNLTYINIHALPEIRIQSLPHTRSVAHQPTAPQRSDDVARGNADFAQGGIRRVVYTIRSRAGLSKVLILPRTACTGIAGAAPPSPAGDSEPVVFVGAAWPAVHLVWRRPNCAGLESHMNMYVIRRGPPPCGSKSDCMPAFVMAGRHCSLGSPLVDDRPIMNAVKHRVVSGWGNGGRVVSPFASHQGDPGSIPGRDSPDFRMWESCRTMPLVSGFSRGTPVPPGLLFRRCSILTSMTLVGSQDHDPLVHTLFVTSWRTLAQSSPSTVTPDKQCAIDICIFVHKTVESTLQDIELANFSGLYKYDFANSLGSPLVDDRPIMNAVKYRIVSGVVWTNRTMVSSNTDINRTGVLTVVDIDIDCSHQVSTCEVSKRDRMHVPRPSHRAERVTGQPPDYQSSCLGTRAP